MTYQLLLLVIRYYNYNYCTLRLYRRTLGVLVFVFKLRIVWMWGLRVFMIFALQWWRCGSCMCALKNATHCMFWISMLMMWDGGGATSILCLVVVWCSGTSGRLRTLINQGHLKITWNSFSQCLHLKLIYI